MKKLRMKILAPALSAIAAAAVVAPAVAVVTHKVNKTVDTNVRQPLTVSSNLFDVKDGTLIGFKSNVTQEQINNYVRLNGNKLVLPACKTIGANAFKNLNTPFGESIVIDVETTKIAPYAFYGCSTVEQIQFKEGVQLKTVKESKLGEIGNSAFAYCSSITELPVPKTLKAIGKAAFYGCKQLRTFNFQHFTKADETTSEQVADLDAINQSISAIGDYAFANTYDGTPAVDNLIKLNISKLPSDLSLESFSLRTKLGGIAGKIGNTLESQ